MVWDQVAEGVVDGALRGGEAKSESHMLGQEDLDPCRLQPMLQQWQTGPACMCVCLTHRPLVPGVCGDGDEADGCMPTLAFCWTCVNMHTAGAEDETELLACVICSVDASKPKWRPGNSVIDGNTSPARNDIQLTYRDACKWLMEDL